MKPTWGRVLVFVLAVFVNRAAAINIDSCGQTVPDKEVGVLTADLDCPAGSTAVTVGDAATLDMNGHAIVVPNGWGVWCSPHSRCTVDGGGSFGAFGEIRGAEAGVYLQRRTRLTARSLLIRDCVTGVSAEDWNNGRTGASARLTNVQVSGSEGAGLRVGRVIARNVTIEGNPGDGIAGTSSSTLRAKGLTVTGNAFSSGCEVYGCGGIDGGDVRGTNLVVSGNAGTGIRALTAKLRNSTVIENVRAGSLRDLVISEKPRLRHVACDVSLGWGSQGSVHWGVCSLDNVP